MMMLRRTDAERNMHRFYALGILPTLFGEWTVISEWGRIGAPGRMQQSTYNNEISAMEALTRRLADKKRRGYRSTAQTLVRSYLAGDQAISEWSDGSTTSCSCKAATLDRKRRVHPHHDQGFDWPLPFPFSSTSASSTGQTTSGSVQVSRTPARDAVATDCRPASEKRQGTKSREVGRAGDARSMGIEAGRWR